MVAQRVAASGYKFCLLMEKSKMFAKKKTGKIAPLASLAANIETL